MKNKIPKFILIFIFGGFIHASAQKADELRMKYPGEQAVVLNSSISYQITVLEGKPHIESSENEKILYLSSNAAAYLSHFSFVHSGFHKLKGYGAYTETTAKKRMKVNDFKTYSSQSSSVFYDDVKETSFDFPGISSGAIGNLDVEVEHKNPYLLTPYYFRRRVPVLNSQLSVTFPATMSIRYLIRGNDTACVKFSQKSKKGQTTYIFEAHDLVREMPYEDAPDNAYYATHVIFYIENYIDGNGKTINFLNNLDNLYSLNYSFIKNINKEIGSELSNIVDSLVKNASSTEQKARNIYRWVQQNIKYVAFEDGMEGFVPREANDICIRKYGDCKDMSSILTTMLNAAGVPAYYTWIGTRSLPYKYTEVPTPIVDNHMICAIQIEKDKFIFLDGTDADCQFGVPPHGIQDKEALIAMGPDKYKVVKVPIISSAENVLVDSTIIQLSDNGMTGRVSVDMKGYFATDMHSMLRYTPEKDREKFIKNTLTRGSNKFQLLGYNFGEQTDPGHLAVHANFKLDDFARKIGEEWYLNLNLFKLYEHEEIDYPKRTTPIEFDFENRKTYITVLEIPPGYKVDYVPRVKSFHNKVWGFKMEYELKDDRLILRQEFTNDHLMLYPDEFEQWNNVLQELYPLYRESVTLSKK